MKTLRVIIKGSVQGVGYRVWTADIAEELGLTGWVRNRADGTVEAVFFGPAEIVDAMIERCRAGPRGAGVTGIETSPVPDEGWPDFSIRPTLRQ